MIKVDLNNPFNGAPVYYKKETTTTMEDACKIAEGGCPSGTVIWAGYQKEGRGRISGRRWLSPPGENLLFTLILHKFELEKDISIEKSNLTHGWETRSLRFPLITGIGIAEELNERFSLPAKVKWPNDVVVEGRKISGVLCRATEKYLLAGVGVNCNQVAFSEGLRGSVCSISSLTSVNVDLGLLLEALLFRFKTIFSSKDWRERLESLLYLKGATVKIFLGCPQTGKTVVGRIEGIAPSGALLFLPRGEEYPEEIVSGEIVEIR